MPRARGQCCAAAVLVTVYRRRIVLRRSVRRSAEDFIKANGLRLCYQTFGEQSRPAIILIMGMGAQMVGWEDDFCELLASRGFWVIRFDNRGHALPSRMWSPIIDGIVGVAENAAKRPVWAR